MSLDVARSDPANRLRRFIRWRIEPAAAADEFVAFRAKLLLKR